MKPLTKTVVSRGGGIAARFASNEFGDYLSAEPKVANAKPVANPLLTVANKPRYAKWREANPELYRERQAEYMRKKRAKDREAGK